MSMHWDIWGSAPLHCAFERWEARQGDIVRLLLNHGADAKRHGEHGNTLLHLAALTGDLELVRMHQQNHRPFSFRLPALYLSRPFPPLLVSLSGSFETPAATAKAFAILFPLSELLTLITVVLHSKLEQIIILLESNLVRVMVGELIDIKRLESI